MSRLDSFIKRLQAQKLLLDHAAAELNAADEALPGPVIELGLGNGRTYDHLRMLLPGRRIIAFERLLAANPGCIPAPEDLIMGDIAQTGPEFARRHGPIAALLHADLGNGVLEDDLRLQAWLPETVVALVGPGGLVLTSTRLDHVALREQILPVGIAHGRYYMYRRT